MREVGHGLETTQQPRQHQRSVEREGDAEGGAQLRELMVHQAEVAGDQLVVVLQMHALLRGETACEVVRQIEIERDQATVRRVVRRRVGVPQ